MTKKLSILLLYLCIVFGMTHAEQRFRYYDHITFYDVYAGTVSEETAPTPEGVFRINNSRVTRLLPWSELEQMGDSLKLEVTITALCDNYDRIGSVDLVLMPKDTTFYSDCANTKPNGGHYLGRLGDTDPNIRRMELARYITPFMNKNKEVDVPYRWDISFLAPLFHDSSLRDSMNLWLELHLEGVPYAANNEIAGCAGRNDVFEGTLDIVSRGAYLADNTATLCEPLVYERYLNTYQQGHSDEDGTLVAHYRVHVDEPLTDAMFLMINSNHGANTNGEEYNRRLHYVWVNEWMASVYRPGRPSCEPFRQYNTQANGIYGSTVKTDASWQSFSNWCPGDVIDNRIVRLGTLDKGDYDFRLLVPDAVFYGNDGYFPFSLTFLGLKEGHFNGIDEMQEEAGATTNIYWQGDQLCVNCPDKQITHWTLLNSAGQRLQSQPGAVNQINMSHFSTNVYVLLLQMDDESVEAHKFFKP